MQQIIVNKDKDILHTSHSNHSKEEHNKSSWFKFKKPATISPYKTLDNFKKMKTNSLRGTKQSEQSQAGEVEKDYFEKMAEFDVRNSAFLLERYRFFNLLIFLFCIFCILTLVGYVRLYKSKISMRTTTIYIY